MFHRGARRMIPDWALPILFLVVWFVLMRWVLPRLGVPT